MTALVICLLAAIVLYALYKNYTVRAGGKALGTAFFFEALKRPDDPEQGNRRALPPYPTPASSGDSQVLPEEVYGSDAADSRITPRDVDRMTRGG